MGIQINGQTDTISAVDGSITVATDLTVPGALTYDDVTNIDSVGLVTARNGLHVTGGSVGVGTDNPTETLTLNHANGASIGLEYSGTEHGTINVNSAAMYVRAGSGKHLILGGNATELLRLTSAGKLGLGEQSPDFKFHSKETGGSSIAGLFETNQTDSYISFQASGTTASSTVRIGAVGDDFQAFINGAERLRITSDGKLGINRTNPTAPITARRTDAGGTGTSGVIAEFANSSGYGVWFGQSSASGASWGATTGDFYWNTGGLSSSVERLRITSTGKVGVGENTPASQVDIKGNVSSTTQFSGFDGLRIHNANGSAFGVTADMYFTAGTGTANRGAAIGVEYSSSTSGNDLYFATNPNAVTSNNTLVERLRITSDGKMGLGTNSPSSYVGEGDNFVIAGSGGAGMTIATGTSNSGTINFADGTSGDARYRGRFEYNHSNDALDILTAATTQIRITSEGRLHLGNGGHGTTKVGGQEISGQDYSALLKLYDTRANIWGMQMRRDTGTGPNGIFVRAGNTSSNYSLFVCGTNESNNHLVCRGDGHVGIKTKDPAEHFHVNGAYLRTTPGSSNIKFLEFSFELPSGTTTTIATVTGPVVSSMAIAKFEYVGLYDYADVGFYSGVEMASLRRSSSNSAYTYLQNSEIHAGGNNSSYQPNMFWQNGSNNTSDLMITTGNYVLIMGTIRITTYNLGLSRVISI